MAGTTWIGRWGVKSSKLIIEAVYAPCIVKEPWGLARPGAAFPERRSPGGMFSSARRALINPASVAGGAGLDEVDGVVHAQAGSPLREALLQLQAADGSGPRPIGSTVITPAFGLVNFDALAHTPTPPWPAAAARDVELFISWSEQLTTCYSSSCLALAELEPRRAIAVATPLLGGGAAGAPTEVAVEVGLHAAIKASTHSWTHPFKLRFVLRDASTLAAFRASAEAKMGPSQSESEL